MQIVTVHLSALLQSVEEMWLTNFIVCVKGELNTALEGLQGEVTSGSACSYVLGHFTKCSERVPAYTSEFPREF